MHKIEVLTGDGTVVDVSETEQHEVAAQTYIRTVLNTPGTHVRWSEHGLPGMPVVTHAERFGPSPEVMVLPDDDSVLTEWRTAVACGDTLLGYSLWRTVRALHRLNDGVTS